MRLAPRELGKRRAANSLFIGVPLARQEVWAAPAAPKAPKEPYAKLSPNNPRSAPVYRGGLGPALDLPRTANTLLAPFPLYTS